jgi:uncharacterized membrane protein YphA (DoxX/SURF4 family)
VDANSVLWTAQVLLALSLVAVGYGHGMGFDQSRTRRGMAWLDAAGKGRMRVIAWLELLAAVGVILPGLTGVLPWLTPTAAACVVVLMILAAIFHLRRPGEGRNTVTNIVLGLLAAFVAYGRFLIAPF